MCDETRPRSLAVAMPLNALGDDTCSTPDVDGVICPANLLLTYYVVAPTIGLFLGTH